MDSKTLEEKKRELQAEAEAIEQEKIKNYMDAFVKLSNEHGCHMGVIFSIDSNGAIQFNLTPKVNK